MLRSLLKKEKHITGLAKELGISVPVTAKHAKILEGAGLNITVMSYNGSVDFGLLSCRELVPDIWDLMDHIRDSLLELKEAAKEI